MTETTDSNLKSSHPVWSESLLKYHIPVQKPMQHFNLSKRFHKPPLFYHKVDFSSLMLNSVNKNTGRAKFTIPIIDITNPLSDLKIDLDYDGTDQLTHSLGVGWKMLVMNNYIAKEDFCSVFPENEVYYIMIDGLLLNLRQIGFSEHKREFEYIHSSGRIFKAYYYKEKQTWEVYGFQEKRIYGSYADDIDYQHGVSINWKFLDENISTDDENSSCIKNTCVATKWFLVRRLHFDELTGYTKLNLRYKYKAKDKDHQVLIDDKNNQSFNKIYLVSIDDHFGNSVTLNYKYYDKWINNQSTNEIIPDNYLENIIVTIQNFKQVLKFGYRIGETGQGYLISITDVDSAGLLFNYIRILNSTVMTNIGVLPLHLDWNDIKFTYNTTELITTNLGLRVSKTFSNSTNITSFEYNNYLIVAMIKTINNTKVLRFEIFDKDDNLSEQKVCLNQYVPMDDFESKLLEPGKYSVMKFYNWFALIVYDKIRTYIHMFHGLQYPKNSSSDHCQLEWTTYHTMNFTGLNSVLQQGFNFIAKITKYHEQEKCKTEIEEIGFNYTSNEFTSKTIGTHFSKNSCASTIVRTSMNSEVCLFYDDDKLHMHFKSKTYGGWIAKQLMYHIIPHDLMNNTINIISTILNVEESPYNDFLNYYRNEFLQVDKNFFILWGWDIESSILSLHLYTYVFDETYKVSFVRHLFIPVLYKFEDKDGKKYSIGFTKSIKEFPPLTGGPDIQNIENGLRISLIDHPRGWSTDDNIKMLSNEIWKQFTSQIEVFVYLWESYKMNLQHSVVTCKDRKYQMKIENTSSDSFHDQNHLPIGGPYYIQKYNNSVPMKLYSVKSSSNIELGLDIDTLINRYPTFLGYSSKSGPLKILKFSRISEKTEYHTLPSEEILGEYQESSDNILVTRDRYNQSIFYFRAQLGITESRPHVVIEKIMLQFEDNQLVQRRCNGFEYHDMGHFGRTIYYKRNILIPGSNRTKFGYVEEKKFRKLGQFVTIRTIFDSDDKIVRKFQYPKSQLNSIERIEENIPMIHKNIRSTLFDTTGKLKVADFFPYNLEDEEVGYYGFEKYENNQIGESSKKKWLFNLYNIVENGFSFTGHNYLRLFDENILIGIFTPKNQVGTYLASCWVRTEYIVDQSIFMFQVGEMTPILKVVLSFGQDQNISVLARVKNQSNNWFYLEIIIDLNEVQPSYSTTYLGNSTIEISVIVSPINHIILCVDHIRFSPISNFVAYIYHNNSLLLKEVLHADGLVERYQHDKYKKLVAIIDKKNDISFETCTKGYRQSIRKCITIKPQGGVHVSFSPYSSYENQWTVNNDINWKVECGMLHHSSQNTDSLKFPLDKIISNRPSSSPHIIRTLFSLNSKESSIKFMNGMRIDQEIFSTKNNVEGEFLIIIEQNNSSSSGIWLGDHQLPDNILLLHHPTTQSPVNMYITGNVTLSNVLIFTQSNIMIDSYNYNNEHLMSLNIELDNQAKTTQYKYDEIGRKTHISTGQIEMKRNLSLIEVLNTFNYENDYTDELIYEKNSLDDVKTIRSPSGNERNFSKLDVSSLTSIINKVYTNLSAYTNTSTLVEKDEQYLYYHDSTVEWKPGGIMYISIYNEEDNKIISCIKNNITGNLFNINSYEYNTNNDLVKIVPPLYYEELMSTTLELSPNSTSQCNICTYISYNESGDIKEVRESNSITNEYIYDEDSGVLEFTLQYSRDGQNTIDSVVYYRYDDYQRLIEIGILSTIPKRKDMLKGSLTTNNTIIYQEYRYDDFETNPFLRGKVLQTITYNGNYMGNVEPYIEDIILDINSDSIYNTAANVVSKRIVIPSIISQNAPQFIIIGKKYFGNILEVEYPQVYDDIYDTDYNDEDNEANLSFKVVYQYDNAGHIIGVGIPQDPYLFAKFSYRSDEQIHCEENSKYNYTRSYSYNLDHFLVSIEDEFLKEDISYSAEDSYGDYEHIDPIITKTKFEAKWLSYDDNYIATSLNKDSFVKEDIGFSSNISELCFEKLKLGGYLNEKNQYQKIFYQNFVSNMPYKCQIDLKSRYHTKKILGRKGFPRIYGHKYYYNSADELLGAKYFIGDDDDKSLPLMPLTFSKLIKGINSTMSQDIWNLLIGHKYLVLSRDGVTGINILDHHAVPNAFIAGEKPEIFPYEQLQKDLEGMCSSSKKYIRLLMNFIINEGKFLSDDRNTYNNSAFERTFRQVFKIWNEPCSHPFCNSTILKDREDCLLGMLKQSKHKYMEVPVTEEFQNVLKDYTVFLPDIFRILRAAYNKRMGEAEFDVWFEKIDKNGNIENFYNGYNQFNITHHRNSNLIKNVIHQDYSIELFPNRAESIIKYDNRGNIVSAPYKKIELIEYNLVTNRVSKILMKNGRKITFSYDSKSNCIEKVVTDDQGKINRQKQYIRDENGKSLLEIDIKHNSSLRDSQPDVIVTTFIYGPRGIIGFIRKGEYYRVISDHESSIRLILKGNKVMKTYDYLPFGEIMREFGNNTEADIAYRFTGQEWDDETGLYIFPTRLYDPTIGLFYQQDKGKQYFSPYKYCGNSPISNVDLDGEWAQYALSGILAVVGAYLGGAAANHEWNPLEWKYNSFRNWAGIVGGGVTGALIPFSVSSALATGRTTLVNIGFAEGTASILSYTIVAGGGTGVLYLGAAAANDKWNPTQWDYTSPVTWNGMFEGFAVGTGAIATGSGIYNFIKSGKKITPLLYTASIAGGFYSVVVFVNHLQSTEARIDRPIFWYGFLDALVSATDLEQLVMSSSKIIKSLRKLGIRQGSQLRRLQIVNRIHQTILRKSLKTVPGIFFSLTFAAAELESKGTLNFNTVRSILNGANLNRMTTKMMNIRKSVKEFELTNKFAVDATAYYNKILTESVRRTESKVEEILSKMYKKIAEENNPGQEKSDSSPSGEQNNPSIPRKQDDNKISQICEIVKLEFIRNLIFESDESKNLQNIILNKVKTDLGIKKLNVGQTKFIKEAIDQLKANINWKGIVKDSELIQDVDSEIRELILNHKVVSVAFNKKYVTVMFSANTVRGFQWIKNRNTGRVVSGLLQQNSHFGDIELSDCPIGIPKLEVESNTAIKETIDSINRQKRRDGYELSDKYLGKRIIQLVHDFLIQQKIGVDLNSSELSELSNIIGHEYISQLQEKIFGVSVIPQKMKFSSKDIKNLKIFSVIEKLSKPADQNPNIEDTLSKIYKDEVKRSKIYEHNKFFEDLILKDDMFKAYNAVELDWPIWSITNCAEPKAVTLLVSVLADIYNQHNGNRGSASGEYKIKGATFDLTSVKNISPKHKLAPKVRCTYCKETTNFVHFLTDDDMVNTNFMEKLRKLELEGKHVSYLKVIPRFIFNNNQINSTYDRIKMNKTNTRRNKRSIKSHSIRSNTGTLLPSSNGSRIVDYLIRTTTRVIEKISGTHDNNNNGKLVTSTIHKRTHEDFTKSYKNASIIDAQYINSTLFFLDYCIRRINRKKEVFTNILSGSKVPQAENEAFYSYFVFCVMEKFEIILKSFLNKPDTDLNDLLEMDLRKKIYDKIDAGKLDEIPNMLKLVAKKLFKTYMTNEEYHKCIGDIDVEIDSTEWV